MLEKSAKKVHKLLVKEFKCRPQMSRHDADKLIYQINAYTLQPRPTVQVIQVDTSCKWTTIDYTYDNVQIQECSTCLSTRLVQMVCTNT